MSAKLNVLLVDDEPRILRSLKAALKNDFNITVSSCPLDAKDIIEKQNIDVLVTDQRMPKLSGTELIQWTNKHSPSCKCVLLTGLPKINDVTDQLNDSDYSSCLSKPWDNQELTKAIISAYETKNQTTSNNTEKPASIIIHNVDSKIDKLSNDIEKHFVDNSDAVLTHSSQELLNELIRNPSIKGIIINNDFGEINTLIDDLAGFKLPITLIVPAAFARQNSKNATLKKVEILVKPISLNRIKPVIDKILSS